MKQQSRVKVVRVDATGEEIRASVLVGNAQPSHTQIFVDGNKVFGDDDSFSDQPIGTKQDLVGKEVLLVSSISDIVANPNKTSATHTLNAGLNTSILTYSDDVDEGEIVIYSSTFVITN